MISSDQAEKAVFFLRDSATAYGSQKGYQARCDANLRRVKALADDGPGRIIRDQVAIPPMPQVSTGQLD